LSSDCTKSLPYESFDLSRRARRRQRSRRIAMFCLIIAVAALSVPHISTVWRSIQIRLIERQCKCFTLPGDFVVYAEDPNLVAKLRSLRNYTTESREVDPPSALYHSPQLTELNRYGAFGGSYLPGGAATVFLHELQTPGGARRLVLVEYWHCLQHSAGNDSFNLAAATLDPASVGTRPTWLFVDKTNEAWCRLYYPSPNESGISAAPEILYAGQLDPDDPGRFSIRCRHGTQDAFCDGWLDDSPAGPVLHLALRSASSMSPRDRVAYSRQLESFSYPKSQIVYDDYPVAAEKLLVAGDYFTPESGSSDPAAAALKVPSIWFERFLPYPGFCSDRGCDKQWAKGPILFLGGRSAGGFNRIVRVDLETGGHNVPAYLCISVLKPATLHQQISLAGNPSRLVDCFNPLVKPVRFFAGQRDPNDASHFTIAYQYDGRAGIFDGWLLPDGASVRFKGWPEGRIETAPGVFTDLEFISDSDDPRYSSP
jgi:hypothetical protein